MDTTPATLGAYLRAARASRGLSQTELASRAGSYQAAISEIEADLRTVVSAALLASILHALDATDEERLRALDLAGTLAA
jgi:transcriptional regulator with XRE-family HTH domain